MRVNLNSLESFVGCTYTLETMAKVRTVKSNSKVTTPQGLVLQDKLINISVRQRLYTDSLVRNQ